VKKQMCARWAAIEVKEKRCRAAARQKAGLKTGHNKSEDKEPT